MVVLLTCKNEEDPIKIESARVVTTLDISFSDANNSRISIGIGRKFDLIQAFMHVLVSCKNEDDSIKNGWARVVTTFFPLYVSGDFFQTPKGS